jgi:hypothetical protein
VHNHLEKTQFLGFPQKLYCRLNRRVIAKSSAQNSIELILAADDKIILYLSIRGQRFVPGFSVEGTARVPAKFTDATTG